MLDFVRGLTKRTVEGAVAASGVPALARSFGRASIVILAYHNVVPDEAVPVGDRSLHIPRKAFAQQLDLLMQTHRIVPLDDLVHNDLRSADRARAVITFDDAYHGAVTIGLDELRARDLPATIFVAPGLLGGETLWWDEVAELSSGLDSTIRSHLLEQEAGSQSAIQSWMDGRGWERPELPDHVRTATEQELDRAVDSSRITLGSHTWSHPHLSELASLSLEKVKAELDRSRDWLARRFGSASRPWLAYPYGASSEEVEEVAAASGYELATVIGGGLCRPSMLSNRPRALPRCNVPAGISLNGFRLLTAGISLY